MIGKEVDYQAAIDLINGLLNESDKLTAKVSRLLKSKRSGFTAEKDVAYKLKSFLADNPDVYVLNNVLIRHNDTTCQIDHLVLGMSNYYVIESKNVFGNLSVNEHGEWTRWFENEPTAIDSPVLQSDRQLEMLKKFLKSNNQQFQGRLLGIQKNMSIYSGHSYVAVSSGAISGKGRDKFPNVQRADQVVALVNEHIKKHKPSLLKTLLSSKEEDFKLFSKSELEKMVEFLMNNDQAKSPIDQVKDIVGLKNEKAITPVVTPATSVVQITTENSGELEPVLANSSINSAVEKSPKKLEVSATYSGTIMNRISCGTCNSNNVVIAYGNSYYIRCNDCKKNTPLRNLNCNECGAQARVRKQRQEFFCSCTVCQAESLLHINATE